VTPLISFLSLRNKKIALITHAGADVDAISATGALALFLSKNNSVQIVVPEHASMGAKSIAKKTGTKYKISPSLEEFDSIIMVDFNSWDMVGNMQSTVKKFKGEKYLLDHHIKSKDKLVEPKNAFIDSKAVASCSIVLDLLTKSKAKITPQMATLLAAGITADSAHFLTAESGTFDAMSFLLKKSGKKFSQILELLRVEKGFSQKVAMLKAAKRSRIFKMGKYIGVISEVGAFESDSAMALIRAGADIAFAGNNENRELKISGRASTRVQREAGFDLAKDVFQPLSGFFRGSGGGHPGAAAFNGANANVEKALMKCLELSKKKVSKAGQVQLKEYT